MKTRIAFLVLATALASAAAATAQLRAGTVEINPFAGYLFGGNVATLAQNDNGGSFGRNHIDVDDDVTYGGRIGYNLTSLMEFEAEYSHTDTHFVSRQRGVEDQRLGGLRIDYFLAYATFNFGHRRVVPFFTVGAGGAHLDPNLRGTAAESDTRFTTSAGGGLKFFFNPHFALRLDGRAYETWLGDHSRLYCDPTGFCANQNWLTNATATGGFIIAF